MRSSFVICLLAFLYCFTSNIFSECLSTETLFFFNLPSMLQKEREQASTGWVPSQMSAVCLKVKGGSQDYPAVPRGKQGSNTWKSVLLPPGSVLLGSWSQGWSWVSHPGTADGMRPSSPASQLPGRVTALTAIAWISWVGFLLLRFWICLLMLLLPVLLWSYPKNPFPNRYHKGFLHSLCFL